MSTLIYVKLASANLINIMKILVGITTSLHSTTLYRLQAVLQLSVVCPVIVRHYVIACSICTRLLLLLAILNVTNSLSHVSDTGNLPRARRHYDTDRVHRTFSKFKASASNINQLGIFFRTLNFFLASL